MFSYAAVPLPSQKNLFRFAIALIVVLSLALGYYATSLQTLQYKVRSEKAAVQLKQAPNH